MRRRCDEFTERQRHDVIEFHRAIARQTLVLRRNFPSLVCESASNLDPTPIESQIVEAEAELLFLSVFDRLPTVPPRFFRRLFECKELQRFARGLSWTPMHNPATPV
jgi:hypothetical protein